MTMNVGKQVATVNPYLIDDREGNAALIAAAPELLEALKDIIKKVNENEELGVYTSDKWLVDTCEKALQKAGVK